MQWLILHTVHMKSVQTYIPSSFFLLYTVIMCMRVFECRYIYMHYRMAEGEDDSDRNSEWSALENRGFVANCRFRISQSTKWF